MAGTDAASRLGLLNSLPLGDAYMHLIIPGLTGLDRGLVSSHYQTNYDLSLTCHRKYSFMLLGSSL